MADLTTNFAGIRCPNPFWLASGPPANCGEQVMRAFEAGWGGAVWKTIGEPIMNVSSRYSSVDLNGQRMMGLNNIELISDRPIETNLREIAEVKKRYPKHAVIASLMVESKRETWHDIVKRSVVATRPPQLSRSSGRICRADLVASVSQVVAHGGGRTQGEFSELCQGNMRQNPWS